MELQSLKLENFLSFEKAVLDLSQPSVSLILGNNGEGGSNGSGKSALFDAITYALFGDPIRKIGKDDIVRKKCDKAKVSLELLHRNKHMEIVRERCISRQSTRLSLNIDGVVIDKGSLKETQEYIEKFIGMDYPLFKNSVLFGQNDISDFLEGADKFRKELVSKIFQFTQLDRCLEVIKEELSQAQAEEERVSGQLALLQQNLIDSEKCREQLDKLLEEQKRSQENLNSIKVSLEQQSIKINEYHKMQEEEQKAQTNLLTLLKERDTYFQKIQTEYNNRRLQCENQISVLSANLQTLQNKLDKKNVLQNKLNSISEAAILEERNKLRRSLKEANTNFTQSHAALVQAQTQCEKMRGLHGKCPTCTTELTPERLKSILDPLNTTIQENSEYCTKINEWIINGEKALSELENTSNEINSLKIEFSQYANLPTKESLEKEITEWRASLNALVAPSADSFMVNKEAQIREATSYLNQLKTQDNHPYYLTLVMEYENNKQEERSLQKKILEDQLLIGRLEEQVRVNKESQSKVKELQEKVKQINTQTTLLSVCSEVYGKNGVKTYFIDSVLPLFEFKINSYLQILTKGRITVQLKSQTESKKGDIIEKFELLVLTGDEVLSFENYSGGECKRIAIAVRFALTDLVRMYLGVDTKFLLCDEVSDALDVPGYDALVELLNTLKGEFKHILVISHDVDLQERFSHIVKVTKRDGISSLS